MTSSWASVPRTRAARADVAPESATPRGVRSAALAVSGALLTASAAACFAPLVTASPAAAQETSTAPAVPSVPPAPASTGRSVVFDYSAEVAPNDVYDGERAEAPQPLFRTLGDTVDVQASYTGPAAQLSLVARLLSTTGWSASVPLADEVETDGTGRVRASLDLARLEAKAAVVAEQTGMPFEGLTVELVAVVRDAAGTWTPSVPFQLTAQQLRLSGEPTTLTVREEGGVAGGLATPAAATPQSRFGDLLGWRPSAPLAGIALALVGAGGSVVVRRRREEDEVDRARRTLGRLLLEVHPADLDGLRVVQVATPDALARLAERYGLLVLHWTEGARTVFAVQDEATVYLWASGPAATATVQTDADDDDADRLALAREAARAEAERLEQLRHQQAEQRRRHAEAAAQAQADADRAHETLQEAELHEADLRQQAERAAQAWAALAAASPAAAVVVPAPRREAPAAVSAAAGGEQQLSDRPPREAL